MGRAGSIAKNFHEGSRSEYLGQYVFSAFGSSIPVPHQEDSGIDLYCTLGNVKGNLLYVKNYFTVQIKSNLDRVSYTGRDSIDWLLSHNYPLLVCVVEKARNNVKIYSTCRVHKLSPMKIAENLELDLGSEVEEKTSNTTVLGIGQPILDFDISCMSDSNHIVMCRQVLQQWLSIDQENINRRNQSQAVKVNYRTYEPNQEPSGLVFAAYYGSKTTADDRRRQLDNLLVDLSGEMISCYLDWDPIKYESILHLVKHILAKSDHIESPELHLFKTVVDAVGAMHNHHERFDFDVVTDSNNDSTAPSAETLSS